MVVDPASSQPWCRNREIVRGQGTVAAMPSRSSKAARPRDEPKATNLSTGVRETSRRPLRIFPFDPMFDRFHDPIVSKVPYEAVTDGPAGRLVEVVDFDIDTGQWHTPLDLNSPEVLIGQGLAPSERDRRSHKQMVYAVSHARPGDVRARSRPALRLARQATAAAARTQRGQRLLRPRALRAHVRVFRRRPARPCQRHFGRPAHLHLSLVRCCRPRGVPGGHVAGYGRISDPVGGVSRRPG